MFDGRRFVRISADCKIVVKKEYILIILCLLIWLPAIEGEYQLINGDFGSGEGYYLQLMRAGSRRFRRSEKEACSGN